MNSIQKNSLMSFVKKFGVSVLQVVLMSLFLSSPAFAQFQAVNAKMSTLQISLLSLGGIVATLAFMWCGYKMMFQHAKFSDVSNVLIGGMFVGLSTVLGAWIVG